MSDRTIPLLIVTIPHCFGCRGYFAYRTDESNLVHVLCSWTLSIVSSLSKILTKHNVSEIVFYLRLQVKPTQLCPTDRPNQRTRTRRWIMSRNIICVLIYHRHKPLDHIESNLVVSVAWQWLFFALDNSFFQTCQNINKKKKEEGFR
jgi:hypothetical protein